MTDAVKLSTQAIEWKISPNETKASQNIELSNASTDVYLFKIKCSAPNRFSVKPISGILKSFQKIKIQFVLNLTGQQNRSTDIRDKFNVYTLAAPANFEEKDGLDEYIKQNSHLSISTQIVSKIIFINGKESQIAPEVEHKLEERKVSKTGYDVAQEKIYESLTTETKEDMGNKQKVVSNEIFKSVVETYSSKVGVESSGVEYKYGESMVDFRGNDSKVSMEESELVRDQKRRIISMGDQIKNLTVT